MSDTEMIREPRPHPRQRAGPAAGAGARPQAAGMRSAAGRNTPPRPSRAAGLRVHWMRAASKRGPELPATRSGCPLSTPRCSLESRRLL
jgi:hypothetical protein